MSARGEPRTGRCLTRAPRCAPHHPTSSADLQLYAGMLKKQHAVCHAPEVEDCVSCCTSRFDHLEPTQCSASCPPPGNVAAATAAASPASSVLQTLWGYVMIAMVLYFLISIVNAAVRERLTHDAIHAKGGAGKAGGARPSADSSSQVGNPPAHQAHVHGAQILSALMNVDELSPQKVTARTAQPALATATTRQARTRSPSPAATKATLRTRRASSAAAGASSVEEPAARAVSGRTAAGKPQQRRSPTPSRR
ncbi:hypothetical protein EON66_00730 [archaeon]|nr:MAG: hypothetical protein EON66_00730 [archaeon]